jgi:hypothetical protein
VRRVKEQKWLREQFVRAEKPDQIFGTAIGWLLILGQLYQPTEPV